MVIDPVDSHVAKSMLLNVFAGCIPNTKVPGEPSLLKRGLQMTLSTSPINSCHSVAMVGASVGHLFLRLKTLFQSLKWESSVVVSVAMPKVN